MSFDISDQFQDVALSECCQIISGSTPSRKESKYWDGDINWFTPKDLSGITSKYVSESPEKITQLGVNSCSTMLLPPRTLLLSSRAPIGHIAISTLEACTNQGFKSLVPNQNIDVEYLFYAIKNIVPRLQDLGNGATFKEISKATLGRVKIPLPPLAEQQKIAAILDAADSLIQKDQQLIEHYTALSQSLFLEMFGDPVGNPMGWDILILEDMIEFLTSGSRGWAKYYSETGDLFLRIQNIGKNRLLLNDVTFVKPPVSAEAKRTKVEAGDILLSITADLGRTAVIPIGFPQAYINQHLAIIRLKNKYLPFYVSEYISSIGGKRQFMQLDKGGVKAGLNFSDIKSLKIPNPPITLQNQFAETIQAIEAQKQQAQASLEKSETLFNSLLQRAFKGELTT